MTTIETIQGRIEMRDPRSLTPHPANPRRGNIEAIAESIRENGWHGVVTIQESTGMVVVGWHRSRAAIEVGLSLLPVEVIDCSDAEALRKVIADNRSSDLAEYDVGLLTSTLADLEALTGTLYGPDELADLLARTNVPSLDELESEHGHPDPSAMWPVLRFQVSPQVRDRYEALVEGVDGGDGERFVFLLDQVERARA